MQRPAPVRSPFTIPLVVIVLFIAACVPMATPPAPQAPTAVIGTPPSRITHPTSIVDMTTRTAGITPTVATWQYISGAETFNSKLDTRLLSIFDARAGGRHQPAALPATPAALLADGVSVTHEIVLATGSLVGSRFVQTIMDGGVRIARSDEITYEDLSTGVVTGSASLIKPAMTGTLRTMLGDTMGPASSTQTPGPDPTRAPTTDSVSDAELLTAVAFTSAGDLSVTIHRDPVTGAALSGPVTVTLNAAATDEVISPAGQTLRTAVITGAPLKAPQPAPGGLAPVNCDLVPCAALTYDDGPNAQTTRLLAILEKHKVFATFFQQGGYVRAHPGVAKAVAAAGHTIANHTMSHPYLTKLSPASIASEVQGAQGTIEMATGVVPAYMRPPYGATNKTVAASVGLPQIIWDVDSMDWQSKNKSVFIPRIMSLVKPGSIILQHDVHASTVDGQGELIAQLKGKGFYLVTLPQLLAGIELKPGASYKCRGSASGCVAGR
ncbi:polysaccharide deacetylase family protein [Paenarthrobacter sp. NPDC090517]|uniref:polysaccharide deacetylase family protein n=1 Tax=Paenarthrobacter sp. NPDC090517 TaxID=3364381 RepID=UPI00380A0B1C